MSDKAQSATGPFTVAYLGTAASVRLEVGDLDRRGAARRDIHADGAAVLEIEAQAELGSASATPAVEAGPPPRDFLAILDDTINLALKMDADRLARLGRAWVDSEEVATTRDALVDEMNQMGVRLDLRSIGQRVTSHLPENDSRVRGAVVDAAIATYLSGIADPSSLRVLRNPWNESRFTVASALPSPAPAKEKCAHGHTIGACPIIACTGHFLGGIAFGSD